jgi:hypothetical protein
MTTQQRLQAFATHIGSDIIINDIEYINNGEYGHVERMICKLKGILNDELFCSNTDFEHEDWENVNNCTLQLYDLSEITDEDAIEVAKILGYEVKKDPKHPNEVVDKTALCFTGKMAILGIKTNSFVETFQIMTEVIDYLRSKSYALPFHGFNLIAEGVAVIKKREI